MAYPNFDFETKILNIRSKLREIYYFEVDHAKFYKQNFGDFWVINFPISCQLQNDQFFGGECPHRLVKHLDALEWPQESPDLVI